MYLVERICRISCNCLASPEPTKRLHHWMQRWIRKVLHIFALATNGAKAAWAAKTPLAQQSGVVFWLPRTGSLWESAHDYAFQSFFAFLHPINIQPLYEV